jgi:geranylgeranyl diphosphate synthase type I
MGWEDADGRPAAAAGKRLRPLLTLAVAELSGASDAAAAMPAAVAIELIHNFSLVHDEIQDEDGQRHGRPTLWARFGTAQAINAGDLLFARAHASLTQLSAQAGAACLDILTDATERMIRGQWQDLEFESRLDVQPAEYLDMVAGKTGALIGAAAAVGALCAGRPVVEAQKFERWGAAAGLAFQARDDYLGIWGDPALTGKTTTGDLLRRKKTLPVLLGLTKTESSQALREFLAVEPTADQIPAVVAAMEAAAVRERSEEIAAEYRVEAERLLAEVPLGETAFSELSAIGRLLVERER